LLPGFKVSGEYAKNNTDGANGYQVKTTVGNTGLTVGYKDVEAGAVPFESSLNLKAGNISDLHDFYNLSATGAAGTHVKGMEYEYNTNVAKNTSLNVLSGKNVRATVAVKF
jgi:hypothetical protein